VREQNRPQVSAGIRTLGRRGYKTHRPNGISSAKERYRAGTSQHGYGSAPLGDGSKAQGPVLWRDSQGENRTDPGKVCHYPTAPRVWGASAERHILGEHKRAPELRSTIEGGAQEAQEVTRRDHPGGRAKKSPPRLQTAEAAKRMPWKLGRMSTVSITAFHVRWQSQPANRARSLNLGHNPPQLYIQFTVDSIRTGCDA
jgi:hypothetical protein